MMALPSSIQYLLPFSKLLLALFIYWNPQSTDMQEKSMMSCSHGANDKGDGKPK